MKKKTSLLFTFLCLGALSLSFTLRAEAAGTFVATGSLDGGRALHTAVRLGDGRVLVVGGYTADFAELKASTETYDPNTGAWSLSGAISAPRFYHTANLLLDGRVLVAGGGNGPTVFASTEIWNPATGGFTAGSSMSVPREYHSSVGLSDGRILVAGGTSVSDGSFALASAEIYNPVTGTWTATGSMANSRLNFVAVLLADGRVLIAGGLKGAEGGYNSMVYCEIFNPSTGMFTPAASMSKARGSIQRQGVLLSDGRVLVAGGNDQGPMFHDAEIYDPSADAWIPVVGNLTAGGSGMSLTRLSDGHVLAAGGITESFSGPEADADLFDPATSMFAPLAPMHVARYTHTATLLGDGSVLIVGGQSSFTEAPYATSSVERFVQPFFATDGIIWHQPLARNGASADTDPGAGGTLKYRFKLGSTIPIKVHALGTAGNDVTGNANVTGKVVVFGDTDMDGVIDSGELPIDFNGVGEAGGVMDKIGGQLQFNLDTKKLPPTFKCYILQVTVTNTSTGEKIVETLPLQSK